MLLAKTPKRLSVNLFTARMFDEQPIAGTRAKGSLIAVPKYSVRLALPIPLILPNSAPLIAQAHSIYTSMTITLTPPYTLALVLIAHQVVSVPLNSMSSFPWIWKPIRRYQSRTDGVGVTSAMSLFSFLARSRITSSRILPNPLRWCPGEVASRPIEYISLTAGPNVSSFSCARAVSS